MAVGAEDHGGSVEDEQEEEEDDEYEDDYHDDYEPDETPSEVSDPAPESQAGKVAWPDDDEEL